MVSKNSHLKATGARRSRRFVSRSRQAASMFRTRPVRQRSGVNAALLFANAKATEYQVEEIFSCGFADDFADGIRGDAQIHRREFESLAAAQCLINADSRRPCAGQGVLMA